MWHDAQSRGELPISCCVRAEGAQIGGYRTIPHSDTGCCNLPLEPCYTLRLTIDLRGDPTGQQGGRRSSHRTFLRRLRLPCRGAKPFNLFTNAIGLLQSEPTSTATGVFLFDKPMLARSMPCILPCVTNLQSRRLQFCTQHWVFVPHLDWHLLTTR